MPHNKTPSLRSITAAICASTILISSQASADAQTGKTTAPLKENMPYLFIAHQGRSIRIERDIEKSFNAPPSIRGSLMINSAYCPPFCLQPIKLDVPVETIAESEIIDFMMNEYRNNKGVLIDLRSPRAHTYGTIPGSINIPYERLDQVAGTAEIDTVFAELGATRRVDVDWFTQQLENLGITDTKLLSKDWDFSNAKDIIVWSSDSTSPLGPQAIKTLYDAGYPAHKMRWYHGGIAAWHYWGFTTFKSAKD